MSVRREKYDKAKQAAREWHNLYKESENKINKLLEEQKKLQSEVLRWKKLSEELPDNDQVDDLETENKEQRKTIRNLKKDLHNMDEKYKTQIAHLEREKILFEGKIQQLEDARKDLRERYRELKEDYRQLSRDRHNRLEN